MNAPQGREALRKLLKQRIQPPAEDLELLAYEIEQLYVSRAEVTAAIGEDEKVMWYGKMDNIALKRNELRQEIRTRLGIGEEEHHD